MNSMKPLPDQMFFVFDCESVGLHGQTFAVAGGIYDARGKAVEGSEFVLACDAISEMGVEGRSLEDMTWVAENVELPEGFVRCESPYELRENFWRLWEMAKVGFSGILMAVECGWPVEARFLIACIADSPLARNWDGPYPMHEIASIMLAAGMDPKASYDRLPEELPAHNPLADARQSARLLSQALATLSEQAEAAWKYQDLCK